jgi:oxygen-dependent protoporphyrinogen oxidase
VDRVAAVGDVVQVGLASGEVLVADAAVVTVPATALAAIRWTLDGAEALAAMGAMPHASLATVSLGFPRDAVAHPLDGHGLLAASGERRRFLTVLFTSTLFPQRAPADHVLLTATFGGVRHPTDAVLDDEALVALALEELGPLLGVAGAPSLRVVRRWPAALPLAMAGHRERCAAVDAVEASSPRVAFSGAWRDGLALSDVMRGGIAAVDRLLGMEPTPPGEA